jgi:hypothetical protein
MAPYGSLPVTMSLKSVLLAVLLSPAHTRRTAAAARHAVDGAAEETDTARQCDVALRSQASDCALLGERDRDCLRLSQWTICTGV